MPSYAGLEASEGVREVVERVHGIFAMRCPLYRTLWQTQVQAIDARTA